MIQNLKQLYISCLYHKDKSRYNWHKRRKKSYAGYGFITFFLRLKIMLHHFLQKKNIKKTKHDFIISRFSSLLCPRSSYRLKWCKPNFLLQITLIKLYWYIIRQRKWISLRSPTIYCNDLEYHSCLFLYNYLAVAAYNILSLKLS